MPWADKLVITQYVPVDAPLAANIELAMFTIQSRAKPLRGWKRGVGVSLQLRE